MTPLDPRRRATAQKRYDEYIAVAREREREARALRAKAKALAHTWQLVTAATPNRKDDT